MEVLIVTGMSGAGKSRAVNALEDIGYYCVDNLPVKLLPKFVELCLQSQEHISRVAIVVDARGGMWFDRLPEIEQEMKKVCGTYKTLFLECDSQVLRRRFKETRRKHPLAAEKGYTIAEAIEKEREILKPLRHAADYLIDTSLLSSAQLKESILSLFLEDIGKGMTITCMSFGFKYGYPAEADLVMDVRCFSNPFYVEELRRKTGMDREVQEYVLQDPHVPEFQTRLYGLIDYLVPLYQNEGKSQLVIAIGCTGGKHRSVTLTEALLAHLQAQGLSTVVRHRDIHKL